MKRSIFLIAAVLFLAAGFISSCGDDEKDKSSTVALKSVKFISKTIDLALSDELKTYTVALNYELDPIRANNIESVTWTSSAPGIATVSPTGLVTSKEIGTAKIKVTVKVIGGATFPDECTINVVSAPIGIEKIEFEEEGQILAPGESVMLTPIFTPEDASNKSLLWESNKEKIAIVNEEGVVTALPDTFGIVVISAITVDGGLRARYTIDARVVVVGVMLEAPVPNKPQYNIGEEIIFKANVLPENATNNKVTWKSSNTAVATVDGNGKVTTRGAGNATITVTADEGDGDFFDERDIVVLPTSVISVEFENNAKLEMKAAEVVTLKAIVLPTTATNQKLIWDSSEKSVATVDETGKVTAIDVGTTIIKVTTDDGGFFDEREIEVVKIPVTGMYLEEIPSNAFRGILYEGINNEITVNAIFEPSDATVKTITWETTDAKVAVAENNKLTIKGSGTVILTAKSTDGGFTSSLSLKINEFYAWLNRSNWTIYGWNSSYNDVPEEGPGWSSQAPYDGGARITRILTDNDGEFWHSSWNPVIPYPNWFIVDLGEEVQFDAVMLRRRTNNSGTARGYYVRTSLLDAPFTWTDRGEYEFNPTTDDRQITPLDEGVVNARYIMLYFDTKHTSNPKWSGTSSYAMFSQFGLYIKN